MRASLDSRTKAAAVSYTVELYPKLYRTQYGPMYRPSLGPPRVPSCEKKAIDFPSTVL